MSCSGDKESFISLKMNVLQNHLWLSQNENSEYCFYDTKIFLQNWNLCLCEMIFFSGFGKTAKHVPQNILCFYRSHISVTVPDHAKDSHKVSTSGCLHQGLSVFDYGMDWLTQYYPLCLVPSNRSSYRKRYFLFWNRMNADKESHGIATEGFVYIKQSRSRLPWSSPGHEGKPFHVPLCSRPRPDVGAGRRPEPSLPMSRLSGTG